MVSYEWRGAFANDEVNRLHAEGFHHRLFDDDWNGQAARYSLGWVCARDVEGALVGFVNVPWDGKTHAFILDTLVAVGARRQGIGTRLVAIAVEHAREAGCEWVHADFDDELGPFYLGACGFRPTPAGLIEL
jgi:GNAT superfamily N-acetyltransferase